MSASAVPPQGPDSFINQYAVRTGPIKTGAIQGFLDTGSIYKILSIDPNGTIQYQPDGSQKVFRLDKQYSDRNWSAVTQEDNLKLFLMNKCLKLPDAKQNTKCQDTVSSTFNFFRFAAPFPPVTLPKQAPLQELYSRCCQLKYTSFGEELKCLDGTRKLGEMLGPIEASASTNKSSRVESRSYETVTVDCTPQDPGNLIGQYAITTSHIGKFSYSGYTHHLLSKDAQGNITTQFHLSCSTSTLSRRDRGPNWREITPEDNLPLFLRNRCYASEKKVKCLAAVNSIRNSIDREDYYFRGLPRKTLLHKVYERCRSDSCRDAARNLIEILGNFDVVESINSQEK